MLAQQGLPLYGPQYEGDGVPGGGQASGTQDQTDWKAKYESVQGQIASGQYVSKDAYVGLQQKLEGAVNERKQIQQNFDGVTAKLALIEDNFNRTQATVQELQGTVSTKDQELAKLNGKLERHNVILKQFPQLATFEADGLIPDPGKDQTLEQLLTAFDARVSALQTQAKTDYGKGSTSGEPPKANLGGEKSARVLLAEAIALQSTGKVVEYELAMQKYHAAKEKEAKAA